MPYIIRATTCDADSVVKNFDPELTIEQMRTLVRLTPLSDIEKRAIPRTLLASPIKSGGTVPDIIGWSMGPWIISERIRDQIERLEPNVHEYIPLNVHAKHNREQYGGYNLILLTQSLDAVVVEKTRFHDGFGLAAAQASNFALRRSGPSTLRSQVIRGYHLWRGAGRMWLDYFCSDELGNFVIEQGLRGWDLRKCEIDR